MPDELLLDLIAPAVPFLLHGCLLSFLQSALSLLMAAITLSPTTRALISVPPVSIYSWMINGCLSAPKASNNEEAELMESANITPFPCVPSREFHDNRIIDPFKQFFCSFRGRRKISPGHGDVVLLKHQMRKQFIMHSSEARWQEGAYTELFLPSREAIEQSKLAYLNEPFT